MARSVRVGAGHKRAPESERFWAKVDKNGPIPDSRPELGPCWLWTGAISPQGYGRFAIGSALEGTEESICAYVWSYQDANGPVGEGLTHDHLCRVRACVRPSHLEAVTHRANVLRGQAPTAVNATKTHCPRGHPYEGRNLIVKPDGARQCRECNRDWSAAFNLRKRQQRKAS